ncbi:MAG TPA: hypothetical protein P5556_02075 [Candidatus Gastranaerophilales bacterium]|nr:hypothetical protein [Candidatus Gastranaerophilales bacterium]
MLKCCGKQIKPKRFSFTDDDGLKVLKIGYCRNSSCGILVIEIESITLFGKVQKETLRGKKALRYIEDNKHKLLETKRHRQYRNNTAKGFCYSNTYWDLKKNKIRLERRELATDRLISKEEIDLIVA